MVAYEEMGTDLSLLGISAGSVIYMSVPISKLELLFTINVGERMAEINSRDRTQPSH